MRRELPTKALHTEPFVMLPRELLRSDAWRSLGINERRFIDFLMLEHLAHGGKENGLLLAPYEQLEAVGVGARYISDVIRKLEATGIIDRNSPGVKRATLYALTWLNRHDGTPPSNLWREYRNPVLKPLPAPKKSTSTGKREGSATCEREGRPP